jgi:50S ribosomal subunit-associated GTPase HflX
MRATAELLAQLDLGDRPRITVLNKIDLVNTAEWEPSSLDPKTIALSATDPRTTGCLLDRLSYVLAQRSSSTYSTDELLPM